MSALAEGYSLEKGRFIVATDVLDDGTFSQAVIYITQSGEKGSYGLMINRPMDIALEEVMPEEGAKPHAQDDLFFGGPLHNQYIFSLSDNEMAEDVHKVDAGVVLGAGFETLSRLLNDEQQKAKQVRAYVGFASWTPGQLEDQIEKGQWIVVPAESGEIFASDTEALWSSLYTRWGGKWT
jgi:putative transcriptional regulator